jgi:hypothetical protein
LFVRLRRSAATELTRASADLAKGYFPQTFHYKLAWLCSAFNIIGGGTVVTSSMIMAMLADVVNESQR